MVPIAQRSLDHALDGAIEGLGVCFIGRGRGCALRPLLALGHCAHAGRPLADFAAVVAGLVALTGAVPLIKDA